MGQSFQSLLDQFVDEKERYVIDTPDPNLTLRLHNVENTVQLMLELLRDKFEQ